MTGQWRGYTGHSLQAANPVQWDALEVSRFRVVLMQIADRHFNHMN
jgi:hypothetical protein